MCRLAKWSTTQTSWQKNAHVAGSIWTTPEYRSVILNKWNTAWSLLPDSLHRSQVPWNKHNYNTHGPHCFFVDLSGLCPKPCANSYITVNKDITAINLPVYRGLGSYWPFTNHYDTPENESRLWTQAMGLPDEDYFYWRDNLVIMQVRLQPTVYMPIPDELAHSSVQTFSYIAGLFVFMAGVTLSDICQFILLCLKWTMFRAMKYVKKNCCANSES